MLLTEKEINVEICNWRIIYVHKNPRKSAGWNVKHDIEQLGISQNAFTQDNILASFLRRTYNRKLTMVDEAEIFLNTNGFKACRTL